MKTILLILATVIFLVPSPEARAIGDTEAGILYGLGIYKIYDVITQTEPWEPGQDRGSYGTEFPPFRCKGDAIECAYQRGVYEREKEEWEDRRQKAYECGRYGKNCEQ